MKIRKSFVSNSSSSSFVCDACGDTVGGWDLCLSDVDWAECQNDHTLCSGELDFDEIRKFKQEAEEWMEKVGSCWRGVYGEKFRHHRGYDEWRYRAVREADPDFYKEWMAMPEEKRKGYEGWEDNIPAELCPICNFSVLSDSDIRKYILKKSGLTMDQWAATIRDKFGDYKRFQNYLRS